MHKKTFFLVALTIACLLVFSGCIPKPYTIDIPQGNLLDKDRLAEVKVGMATRQVLYLLGTPLITDTFEQNRWDYFYGVRDNRKMTVEHHVTIYFIDGKVSKIEDKLN